MKVALNTINHHLLPLMAYDYLFGIFKLFFMYMYNLC